MAHAGSGRDRVTILLYWVELGGNVLQVAGMAPSGRFPQERALLTRSAESLRPLSAAERRQIRQSRLRLLEADRGERLAQIVEQTRSSWSPEELAIANGFSRASVPEPGPVKVAVPELYRPR